MTPGALTPSALSRAAFGLVAGCVLACGGARAAPSVTFCAEGAPEGFDIAQYETLVTNDAAGLPLYDPLLRMRPGSTEVVPGLAQRWEISDDGRVYTLHLRPGVKFHTTAWFKPTRDMNADDVVWSLNRINDKTHPAHAAAQNGFPYWAGMSLPSLIQSVQKVDDLTVRIALTRPESPFLADLTMSAIASVYSAEYGEQLLKAGRLGELNTQPIGTGPFAFKSYQKDAVIRYTAHPAHWAGAPKVELIFAITPDPAVRVQRVKAGECLAGEINADQAQAFEGNARIGLLRNQPLATSYIAPNARHPFLSDKRFREALSLAIDRPGFVQSVYAGQGQPAGSFLPPGIWSHEPSTPPRDLDRARKLVKESGYDGRELMLYATARKSDIKRAVELLQADWAQIGVRVTPQLMELGELYKRTGKGDHDLALLSWFSDNGDPDNFLTPNLSCAASEGGGNKAHWCNKAFDELLNAARSTAQLPQRTELYVKAQRLLREETGLIPLAYRLNLFAVSNSLKGFTTTPFGNSDFRSTRVD